MKRARTPTPAGATRPGAAVLGLTANGVGVLHSLSALRPVPDPILGVECSRRAIGFASRVGETRLCPPPWQDDGRPLCEFLLTLARQAGRPLVAIPSSDDYVQFVSNHRDSLEPRFRFLLPEREMVDTLLDKARFAALAAKLGVPAPAFAVTEAAPAPKLPAGFRFPVVAKPLNTFKDNPLRSAIKVEEFASPEAWDRFFESWAGSGQLVAVQEKIVGEDTDVYVYGAIWNGSAEPVSAFTARKIRQFPRNYGSTARAVCEFEPTVMEMSESFLRAIHYQGLCDVEFKRDARDGTFMIIEVNPRQGLWHRVGRSTGIDIIQDTYRLLSGDTVPTIRQRAAVSGHWCYLARDIQRLKQDLKRRPASLAGWLRSYLQFPRDAVFAWSDPGPWAKELWWLFTRRWRRKRRKGDG